ncbi:MAG: carboxypeptidase regulatory-like domain-containing protein [Bacteroidia bacterium]|nr:carboxypeptidase regulatory-like domain-containing protein [Bacteroidia bacterium]
MCAIVIAGCIKEKDKIEYHSIKGNVYNLCTDSGLANIKVYLLTSNTATIETISDSKGNYIFENVPIHSLSKYKYAVSIPGKSGAGTKETAFEGATIYFNKTETDTFFVLKVIPSYTSLYINFITNDAILGDTIFATLRNYTFHKNVPHLPYPYTMGSNAQFKNISDHHADAPMGKYNIEYKIKKIGIVTLRYDSLYIGMNEEKKIVVNW